MRRGSCSGNPPRCVPTIDVRALGFRVSSRVGPEASLACSATSPNKWSWEIQSALMDNRPSRVGRHIGGGERQIAPDPSRAMTAYSQPKETTMVSLTSRKLSRAPVWNGPSIHAPRLGTRRHGYMTAAVPRPRRQIHRHAKAVWAACDCENTKRLVRKSIKRGTINGSWIIRFYRCTRHEQ